MANKINKIIRNSVEYVIEDADAQTSIDSIVENFNKLEIPDKTSDLENDSGYINQIKTINGQSLVGEGNITIQGGEGGSGSQIIEISSSDYNELTDEQKNDPTILYVISDGQSEYYKKNEVYNKTESDAKYSLKGEGKTYNSGRNIVIDDNNNINAYNVLTSIAYENSTNNTSLIYYRYTNTGSYNSVESLRFPKLRINGSLTSIANNSSTVTNSIDLDSVYAKTTDIPDVSNFATKSEIETTIGNINNILNTI